jgi:hypothetical protein
MTQALLQRAQTEGTPLIEDDRATFVWRGRPGKQAQGSF